MPICSDRVLPIHPKLLPVSSFLSRYVNYSQTDTNLTSARSYSSCLSSCSQCTSVNSMSVNAHVSSSLEQHIFANFACPPARLMQFYQKETRIPLHTPHVYRTATQHWGWLKVGPQLSDIMNVENGLSYQQHLVFNLFRRSFCKSPFILNYPTLCNRSPYQLCPPLCHSL